MNDRSSSLEIKKKYTTDKEDIYTDNHSNISINTPDITRFYSIQIENNYMTLGGRVIVKLEDEKQWKG